MKNVYLKCYLLAGFLVYSVFCPAQNLVSTYSGTGNAGFANGTLNSSSFNEPFGLCIDRNNNLYIADGGNNCIRKINTQTGMVTTFAGTGTAGWKDGAADSAMFNSPSDLCVDDSGNVYVSDFLNQRIRKISSSGNVTTVAGSGIAGFLNGINSVARFNYPRGICRDSNGSLYVGDSWNHRIRKIDLSGNVSTYAGGGNSNGVSSVGNYIDASDTSARFYTPSGLTIDGFGNIYVADAYNHRIRKIDTLQNVTTVAGSGATGVGSGGYLDGGTNAALLNTPTEVFMDTANNELYVGDTFNNRIRLLNFIAGTVSTFAGSGSAGFNNAVDSLATFDFPRGLVVADSPVRNVFLCDFNNHSIRLISQSSTGLYEKSNSNDFTLYPNPGSSKVRISFNRNRMDILEVFDVSGKLILKREHNHHPVIELDCNDFGNGFYLFKVTDNIGKCYYKKFIKE